MAQFAMFGQSRSLRIADIGSSAYGAIIALQMFLVLAVAPAMTSGMVKGEKERETFEFLRATSITPFNYLFGALLSSLLLVALSLLCAFPVLSLALLYGGVQGILPSILTLLAVSLYLSSQGLMMSAAAEKLKTASAPSGGFGMGFGIGFAVFLSIFFFGPGLLRSLGPAMILTPITALQIPLWAVICIACILGSILWLLVAHRKFFDPSERALNPTQFLVVWGIAMLLGSFIAAGHLTAQPVTSMGKLAALAWPLLVALLGGLLAPPVLLMTRLRMGDERWHLRNRHPALRHRNDPLRSTLLIQFVCLAVIAVTASYVFANSIERGVVLVLCCGLTFAVTTMATILFHHRTPFVSQAGNWTRMTLSAFCLLPTLGLTFRSTTPVTGAIDEGELLAALSPIGHAVLATSNNYSDSTVLATMVLTPLLWVLAATILVIMVRRSEDPHALEVVAYDDGTVEYQPHRSGSTAAKPAD
jgi:ABC-type transport system involved in multi-copper enzyme maturation permease subunit